MKILPTACEKNLTGHDVFTVSYKGWTGLRNGQLLQKAEEDGTEVILTGDRTLVYEQNLSGRDRTQTTSRPPKPNSIETVDRMGRFINTHQAKKPTVFGGIDTGPVTDCQSVPRMSCRSLILEGRFIRRSLVVTRPAALRPRISPSRSSKCSSQRSWRG